MKAQILRMFFMVMVLFAMVGQSFATTPTTTVGKPQFVSNTLASCLYKGITIPITVTNFSNIASMSLTLKYDSLVLHYDSATVANMPISWTFSFGTAPDVPASNIRKLIMGAYWDGSTVWNMADNGEIVLTYWHVLSNGSTDLTWDWVSPACEYGSAATTSTCLFPPCALSQTAANYVNGYYTPIIGNITLHCPSNISRTLDQGVCSTVVTWLDNVARPLPYDWPNQGGGNASTTASYVWQSFTPDTSGILTGIGLTAYDVNGTPSNGTSWTYNIFKGEGVFGCPLYTGSFNAHPYGQGQTFTLPVGNGVYVKKGEKYSFQILGGCSVGCPSNPANICVDLLATYNTGWHKETQN
jgi:hypothetical protein